MIECEFCYWVGYEDELMDDCCPMCGDFEFIVEIEEESDD